MMKYKREFITCWILVIFAVIILFPFYWTLKSSFSGPEDLVTIPPVYFPSVTLDNYFNLADQIPLCIYIRNSIIFSFCSALVSILAGFLAAYAFVRFSFRGSSFILWTLVLSMTLPEIATIIPLYQVLGVAGLLDSLLGLILVMSSALSPFTVWCFIPFIQQVPYAIEEAAIIDGAGLFRRLYHVYLPLCIPATITLFVINFISAWNNLVFPLAFSATDRSKCLSVAITEVFQAQVAWGKPWHLISAIGIIMFIPSMLLILFFQRAIISGLSRGAVK